MLFAIMQRGKNGGLIEPARIKLRLRHGDGRDRMRPFGMDGNGIRVRERQFPVRAALTRHCRAASRFGEILNAAYSVLFDLTGAHISSILYR